MNVHHAAEDTSCGKSSNYYESYPNDSSKLLPETLDLIAVPILLHYELHKSHIIRTDLPSM